MNEECRKNPTLQLLMQEITQLYKTVAQQQADIDALKASPPAADVLVRIAVALETIASASDDSAKVKELTDKLKVSGDALGAAIAANTPKNP